MNLLRNHSQHLSPLQSLDSRLPQSPQPAEPANAASKTGGIILGALEPLTAVVIGVLALSEAFTLRTAAGIILIIIAVTAVVLSEGRHKGRQ